MQDGIAGGAHGVGEVPVDFVQDVFRRSAESKLFELEEYSWKGSRKYTTRRRFSQCGRIHVR